MAKSIRCAVAVILALTLWVSNVLGTTYYVDQKHPKSSDDNPGSEEQPWQTITHAAAVAEAGDTIKK